MNQSATRFLALDMLRGMTVALMIIVNTPGSWDHVYAPLLHAQWHGITPTDLVFPTFLFAVGNALSFTLDKYAALGQGAFLAKTMRRTLLIFATGVLLYWLPFFKQDAQGLWQAIPFSATRIPGVLQRIALTYCAASLLLYYFSARYVWIMAAFALLSYWGILAYWGDYTMAGNAARAFDLAVLGEAHLYHGEGMAFDPEGLLGTMPASVNVLAGYGAGRVVQRYAQALPTGLWRLLAWGVAALALGWLWQLSFPLNKKLWSSSYVLVTIGVDLLVLAALLLIIERWQWRRWTHLFSGFGRNTLAIYLLSELMVIVLINWRVGRQTAYDAIYQSVFLPIAGPLNGSLLFAFVALLLCWLCAWALEKKQIYIKL